MSRILEKIDTTADLKDLNLPEMEQLAGEVRAMIIETVSKTGGHLGTNLGVIELTVALLKVFDPPLDKIIWDVGHQTYAYKILTDRKDRFSTLRQFDGVSGFPKRDESKFDVFGAGHAGTALSAGLGMAFARDRKGGDENIVVVTGDASAGNGISLEALNNLAGVTGRLIVVLNDNEMSISRNVGSMSGYMGKLLANPRYNRWKRGVESAAKRARLEWLRSVYYRLEESVKNLFLHSVIFEEFGLRYIGPVDGHSIHALIDALTVAREYDKPIILHVATQKGKGYEFAEDQPEKWHGTPGFDIETGETAESSGQKKSYSKVFGETIERLAAENDDIVAITAAMTAGTGLTGFAEKFPGRFFDVGMSEEHAVVFAAGLACADIVPVVAIYSTFMQRSIDCIIHDVCLQKLPVVMCLDRAGVVGDDGPTHHGVFDIALLRPVPNLVMLQPRDEAHLADMLYTAIGLGGPVVIRYPRGCGPGVDVPKEFSRIPVGTAEIIKQSAIGNTTLRSSSLRSTSRQSAICFWALGDMVPVAEEASEILEKDGCSVTVVDARFIKPLDTELLREQSKSADAIITLENGVLKGGFGSGVQEFLAQEGYGGHVLRFGWPDEFIPQGSIDMLMEKYGLTAESISRRVRERVFRKS